MQKPMTRRTTKRSTLRVQSDLAKPLQTAFCRASRSDLFWNNYSFWKQCSKQQCLESLFLKAFHQSVLWHQQAIFKAWLSTTSFRDCCPILWADTAKFAPQNWTFGSRILWQENFQGLLSHYLDVYTAKDVPIEIWSNKGLTMKNGGLIFKMERVN